MPREVDVVSRIILARSIDVVSAFAENPDNAPTWYVNIESVVWISSPPPSRPASNRSGTRQPSRD